ncbi:hypothetical protein GCM10008090_34600 [Arenicella chitinivorans]|uniref:MobA-like NTP transferase domain-containing protein n=1 Tax=Arenicella chitinivorans TaxID=1329800 RepID=A0A918S2J2_9GAMM|nr:hypothetical protein GCM10008090_34600 [Arenicella chitinivorans]
MAAGRSQRFGGPKLRHRLSPSGEPMIVHTIRRYQAVFERPSVVIASHDDALREIVIQTGVHVIDNPAAEQGMSQSIVQGVSQTSSSTGWLIALGDMPWVSESTVQQLLAHAHPERIVVPSYQHQDGNPVLFGAQFAPQLKALTGDHGGKVILQSPDARVRRIATGDQGILRDVDTPADLINRSKR